MAQICVDIKISASQILKYYQGAASTISALATDGRRVQFPANLLRPFMSHSGVYGKFIISFDEHGKFNKIEQIDK